MYRLTGLQPGEPYYAGDITLGRESKECYEKEGWMKTIARGDPPQPGTERFRIGNVGGHGTYWVARWFDQPPEPESNEYGEICP